MSEWQELCEIYGTTDLDEMLDMIQEENERGEELMKQYEEDNG
jgi:hypothetical protein